MRLRFEERHELQTKRGNALFSNANVQNSNLVSPNFTWAIICRKIRTGTGFCFPSPCGGCLSGFTCTIRFPNICIIAIFHEDLPVTAMARDSCGVTSYVGLV